MDQVIYRKLQSRDWKAINDREWAAIVKSVVHEDKHHEWTVLKQPVNEKFLSLLPDIGTTIGLSLDKRSGSRSPTDIANAERGLELSKLLFASFKRGERDIFLENALKRFGEELQKKHGIK
jgi:hypothetical protein